MEFNKIHTINNYAIIHYQTKNSGGGEGVDFKKFKLYVSLLKEHHLKRTREGLMIGQKLYQY